VHSHFLSFSGLPSRARDSSTVISMAAQHDQESPGFAEESLPLLEIRRMHMAQAKAAGLCTCGVVTILAIAWCILDFWNHKLSEDLFNMGNIRMADMTESHHLGPQVLAPFKQFSYPLSLAFLQFVFMGVVFLGAYLAVVKERPPALALFSDKRWPSLVISHVISTFWLQSLMMPAQVMSLGAFSASRAFEIPIAAALRQPVLGVRVGKKTLQTTGLAFVAACTLYFAYAEMAGCVCIMSGHGVALTGAAFWIIYGLILGMPAANAVCQEGILKQPGMHPLMLLALQNIFAALLFGPILMIAHLVGWEDVGAAFQTIRAYPQVFMMVTWLCAQMAVTSVVCIMLITVVDSFWAIALRALRVVFWAMTSLTSFYLSAPGVALSIASPTASFWSFVICCGAGLAGVAIYTDRRAEEENARDKGGFAGEKASGRASA